MTIHLAWQPIGRPAHNKLSWLRRFYSGLNIHIVVHDDLPVVAVSYQHLEQARAEASFGICLQRRRWAGIRESRHPSERVNHGDVGASEAERNYFLSEHGSAKLALEDLLVPVAEG